MRKSPWAWIVILILVSACSRTAAPTSTPTPVPSSTPRALPPTWTAGALTPITLTPSPTLTFIALNNAALSALPPTWTPAPLVTVTPIPVIVPTLDPYALTLTVATAPSRVFTDQPLPTQIGTGQPPLIPLKATFGPECSSFAINPNLTDTRLTLGSGAIVSWYKAQGIQQYHIWVVSQDGHYLFNAETTQDTINLSSSIFTAKATYGWELVAYSGDNPVCQHLTGLLIVS